MLAGEKTMKEQIKLQGKIKELSKQAGFTGKFDFPYGANLEPTVQRFAELIVKECAGIYNKIDNGNAHLGTENYLEALQKHFGVKS